MPLTFEGFFRDKCAAYSDKVLVYDTSKKRHLTYAECQSLTEMVSSRLLSEGIAKGDIIMTYSPLSLESVLLCWASLNIGAIFLPADHSWPLSLLKQMVEEADPKLVLTTEESLSACRQLVPDEKVIVGGEDGFFTWLEQYGLKDDTVREDIQAEDPSIILYTSGSTGRPKGVMLSQQALLNSGRLVADHFGWETGDTFLNIGDLHSMSGLRNTSIAPLVNGSSFIIALEEERNSVLHIIDLINTLDIQYVGVAPTLIRQLNLLFTDARKDQLSPLKAILCTAGFLSLDQLREFYSKYSIPVYNYYGLTETAGICAGHNSATFSPLDNSIGPSVEADFILLPDEAYDDPDTGELVVNSNNLMMGYYKRPDETTEVLKEDGFHTGDIVRCRSDGCYELLGRKKNFIKNIHAELIHLEEIDQALESFQGIKEACTVRFREHAEDEKIVAYVVPEAILEDEKAFIEELKVYLDEVVGGKRSPWCYIIRNKLPRNSPGKIERNKLEQEIDVFIRSEHTRYF